MLSAGSMLIQPALGKEYPTRPIEIVVPYPPGNIMYNMSRAVADTAPKYLGQPLVVVSKPGAGGSIAAADAISSKPDGYKLVTLTSTFFSINTKTQKVPFDPNDLAPLVNFMQFKEGFCVRADSPWKTFNDLLDYGRKNPGKLRWAHTGRGVAPHIALLLIFRKAGVETIDVPYPQGTSEKLPALLGGHVDAASMPYGTIKDHVRAGKIRFLIFFTDRRFSDPSDVPTAVELGFPEVAKLAIYAPYFVHKDTPEEIKKTLISALTKTNEDPEFKKELEKVGEEPRFGGPEFIRESIKKAEEIAVPILKEFGLYVGK